MGAFLQPAAAVRPLWRLDSDDPHKLGLFIVSSVPPSVEHIVEQFGWPTTLDETALMTRPYDPMLALVQPGEEFAFRLTANPTVSVSQAPSSDGRKLRGKVVPLTTRTQQLDWIRQRSGPAGFELIPSSAAALMGDEALKDLRLMRPQRLSFKKAQGDNSTRVTLHTVTYEGRLRVTDPGSLRRSLTEGIGRAKAYGCGLMTLAPAAHVPADKG